jgi:hypothetical protein
MSVVLLRQEVSLEERVVDQRLEDSGEEAGLGEVEKGSEA